MADGRILGVFGVARDISYRKAAEVALIESEERYRRFIEQSTEGVSRVELDPGIPVTLPEEEQVDLLYQRAIIAECGYFAYFQREVASSVKVPVFLSSLLQIPWAQQVVGANRVVGVLMANSNYLTDHHLESVGVRIGSNYVIGGAMTDAGSLFAWANETLRLPGRHHTRPHYTRVYNFDIPDEPEWLDGGDAIEVMLAARTSPLPKARKAKKNKDLREVRPQKEDLGDRGGRPRARG